MNSPARTAATRSARPVLRFGAGLSVRYSVRPVLACVLLLAAAAGCGIALIGAGEYPVAPQDVARALFGDGSPADVYVVRELRLPRALTGLLAGAALALAGAVFQSVARNPLGSPDVIGFGQGSAAGALCAIVLLHGSTAAVQAGSVIGGLLTGALIYLLAWRKGIHGYRLVLVGIGGAAVLTGVNQYLLTRAAIGDATRAVLWLTGSLNGRGWQHVWPLLAAFAVLAPLVIGHARHLGMLEMGDDAASALGVPVERVRLTVMGAATLLTAAATAAAGPLAFVALTGPQLARRLTRSPGPNLFPAACMGGALLLAADWLSQHLFGSDQLPVGAVTGVLGGVYLLWLLASERRAGRI
ncbi:FecCD family ABC transporter permease [Streptomyces gamaensis]|uniref:FecCD family ABC transporter permease n=1 Tax=Streptomyces gamaensis TaxID=1763542 RepID=A0ABW0Z9C0_9ACTN